MRHALLTLVLALLSLCAHAQQVTQMNEELFKKQICDYTTARQWTNLSRRPVVIDLYADWCGPCRHMAPILEQLAKDYAGQVTFYKVNVDQQRELAALFQASSIPLFAFIPADGSTPTLVPGAMTKERFAHLIDTYLLKKDEAPAR